MEDFKLDWRSIAPEDENCQGGLAVLIWDRDMGHLGRLVACICNGRTTNREAFVVI